MDLHPSIHTCYEQDRMGVCLGSPDAVLPRGANPASRFLSLGYESDLG